MGFKISSVESELLKWSFPRKPYPWFLCISLHLMMLRVLGCMEQPWCHFTQLYFAQAGRDNPFVKTY